MNYQVLRDQTFAEGFYIGNEKGIDYPDYQITAPFQQNDPAWILSQWNSKRSLSTERFIKIKSSSYEISNKAKKVKRDDDGSLSLEILGSKEYQKPRVLGESWPHLIVEQKFMATNLRSMKSLIATLDMDFLSFKNLMKTGFDPELHTLQLVWQFQIGDLDVTSYSFGDFFFFGLPIIDVPRYDFPKEYCAEDYGKRDATHKVIISIDPHKYMKEKFGVGDNLAFSFDILPEIKKAFILAQKKGYMEGQTFENMQIVSTKIGFEDTGTFDGSIKINRLSLEAEL